jgi:hypothetical protein
VCTHVYSKPICTIGFSALHVSVANRSNIQGATSVEHMYSVLYRLTDINGKIFIHISVIP